MYEAYKSLPVLERLPLHIECIACYEIVKIGQDFEITNVPVNSRNPSSEVNLLLGTKPGHLLVYKVQRETSTNIPRIEVTLEKSHRSFSKRPIQQLFVCAELKILISLSDGLVAVHDLVTFRLISTLTKAKGALLFAADLEEKTSSTGNVAYALKLCVVIKRKLQFYFWKNRDFVELHADVSLPETPKCLSWCRDTLCIGLKRDYMMVKLMENEPLRELFPTGKSMEPVVGQLDSDQLIVMKDAESVFVDYNGAPTFKHSFKWSDIPTSVESQPPFLSAVLPKHVEIQTIEPRLLIQKIDFPRAKMFCCYNDWLFVSSNTHIWLLQQNPIPSQVKQLLQVRQYELALKLAKMSNEQNEAEKLEQIRQIRTSLAFELFCQKRFEESLSLFSDLQTDPVQVIGLFPDLLPHYFQKKISYPSSLPSISESELKRALHSLIELLTDKRNKTLMLTDSHIENTYSIVHGNATVNLKQKLLQIIDTTLLKCYLKTNSALVAHLLRLPDNHCHVDEAKRVLQAAGMHRELIELYKSKGHHKEALNLFLECSDNFGNKEESREDMIEYLQHLGADHLDVIFSYSPKLLNGDPTSAIKIFTGDVAEVESLPRKQVFDFLDAISSSLVLAYLEHIIKTLEDETPEFHNRLAVLYRDKVVSLMKEYHNSLPEDDKFDFVNAPLDLMESRKKLTKFLQESPFYQAERILEDFPDDSLVEERAILLGRMGHYNQALALYTYTLKDSLQAEEFCRRLYEADPKAHSEVFLLLLKMYLHPDPDHKQTSSRLDINHAVKLLDNHSNKIDAQKALQLLPPSINITRIEKFLNNVLERLTKRLHNAQVLESLLMSESHQVHEQRIFYESRKCLITDEIICKICKKRIGVSAFARYPNDVVVHYYCYKDRTRATSPGPLT